MSKTKENTNGIPATNKRVELISGAIYHNFEESPIFKGRYLSDFHGKNENGEDKVIGFLFVNTDGEEMIISNSFAIDKALNTEVGENLAKDLDRDLEITFLGKSTIKKTGKPFNRFKVVLCE